VAGAVVLEATVPPKVQKGSKIKNSSAKVFRIYYNYTIIGAIYVRNSNLA